MSELTTYSRDALRGMKAQVDEEKRLQGVRGIIERIHCYVVNQARTTKDTKYKYAVPAQFISTPVYPAYLSREIPAQNDQAAFHQANMPDILKGLEELFPGCFVAFTSITMAQGNDGKMYDVSDLDDKALAFVNNAQKNSYIVIDWT